MREDKVAITKKLEELVNLTRMGGGVTLEYVKDYDVYSEAVLIILDNKIVGAANVSCDSGVALIRDVLKHRFFN